jgi:hypothetical protein
MADNSLAERASPHFSPPDNPLDNAAIRRQIAPATIPSRGEGMPHLLYWERMVNDVGQGAAPMPVAAEGFDFASFAATFELDEKLAAEFDSYRPSIKEVKDLEAEYKKLNDAVDAAKEKVDNVKKKSSGSRWLETLNAAKAELRGARARYDRVKAYVDVNKYQRAASDTRVVVTIDTDDPHYYVIMLDTNNLIDIRYDLVIADLMNWLDDQLNAHRIYQAYQVQQGALASEITLAGGNANDRVFANMRLVSLDDLNKKWSDIFAPIVTVGPGALPQDSYPLGLVNYQLRLENDVPGAHIAIRKRLPIFLLDDDAAYQVYTYADAIATPVPGDPPAIEPGKIWAYRYIPGVSFAPCQVKVQGAGGRGSGGAMRSDRAGEVTYSWWGDHDLGILAGLDIECRLGDAGQGVLLQYKADYDTNKLAGKKNLPKDAPAPPGVLSVFPYSGQAAAVPTRGLYSVRQALLLGGARLTKKKKKGTRTLVAPGAGEALKGGNAETRAQAGAVMKQALSYFMTPPAQGAGDPPAWAGSATRFAGEALKRFDGTSFAVPGGGPSLLGQAAPYLRWGGTMRTDQEWCHLLGHGDGGVETPDNFISGSEHCNTEQLAIECGHRDANIRGLKAKITGYLVPTARVAPAAFSAEQLMQLRQLFVASGLIWTDQNLPTVKDITDLLAMTDVVFGTKPIVPPALQAQLTAGDPAAKKLIRRAREAMDAIVYPAPLPLGLMVRYKIYDSNSRKLFDHSFSAQSEGFDINQFNILYWTVRCTVVELAGTSADKADLQAIKQKKIKKYKDALAAAAAAAAEAAANAMDQ